MQSWLIALVDQTINPNSYERDRNARNTCLSPFQSQHTLALEYFRLLQLQLMVPREISICTQSHECRCPYQWLEFCCSWGGIICTDESAGQAIISHITFHDFLCRFHLLEFFHRRCAAAPHGDWVSSCAKVLIVGASKILRCPKCIRTVETINREPRSLARPLSEQPHVGDAQPSSYVL